MTYILKITDGTDTITLSPSGYVVGCAYVPQVGDFGAPEVVDSAELTLEGTASQIMGLVYQIEQMFTRARVRALTNRSDRVFAQYQSAADSALHRSQILDGRVIWPDDSTKRRIRASGTNSVQIIVSWARQGYWEGPEQSIQWGTGASTSRTISNGDSGTYYNAAEVNDAELEGTLPSPVKLQITNASATGLAWRNFYLCNDGDSGLTGSEHLVLIGSASTWVTSSSHSNLRWIGALSSTQIGKLRGEMWRVIAAFTSIPAGLYLRASIYVNVGGAYALVAKGQEVYANLGMNGEKLVDLGALPIPPQGAGSATAGVCVVISVRSSSGGSATLDFIQLAKASTFKRLYQSGFTLDDGDSVVLDDIDGNVYASAGENYPIVQAFGPQLMVYPGQNNRFTVIFDESNSNYTPGRAMEISATYRPRRSAL